MIDNTVIAGMMGAEAFKTFHLTPGKEERLDVRENAKRHVMEEQARH